MPKRKPIPKRAREALWKRAHAGGRSFAEFCREMGVDPMTARKVVTGEVKANHGNAYQVAEKLGLR